ncbi:MAG: 4Fe-4S dicluster domain-containing protein [Dethiobacter sp.]|jgi:ferredoxin|nr:MAG: 4Fe-4S dicluster domain-containing protein [Dethiobacter sp.]
MCNDVYRQLALHLSTLGMGFPDKEELLDILRENFTQTEAEVALALPTRSEPLQIVSVSEIAQRSKLPGQELLTILERLAEKGVLFSGKTDAGENGYALQQVGYGFPQTFFWKNEDTPHSRKMSDLIIKYFNREVTAKAFAASKTKPFRYIPGQESVHDDIHAVYPYHMMENVVQKAKTFAVANCSCRMQMRLKGKGCNHPLEVCLKFDELAEYVIEKGFGREITKDEALKILKESEEAGLVHMADNAMGDVKHCCNCCGCACWNVGNIRRRRIPRDILMAVYFLRVTDTGECSGCGSCIDICPVDALKLNGDYPAVDNDWCIGCGVCVLRCPNEAVKLKLRNDLDQVPPFNFKALHEIILKEKKLK